ncbi:MAG: metallophosphoesterase [Bacteroidetes bacterium]|nr:metallophosphoesterase [Bacteroidota bacterium]
MSITRDRLILAGVCVVLTALALIYPVWPGTQLEENLGFLLVWLGILEIYDGFRRADLADQRRAQLSGGLSLLMGALLINAILFQSAALHLFIVFIFMIDAIRYVASFIRKFRNSTRYGYELLSALASLVVVVFLFVYRDEQTPWAFAVAVALRIIGTGVNIIRAKTGVLSEVHTDVLQSLGLAENVKVRELAEKIRLEEEHSAPYDRAAIITFILVLFFIHLGRMGMDRSMFGILSPLVATLGDIVIALIITYAIFAPIRLGLLKLFRRSGHRLWDWALESGRRLSARPLVKFWLSRRIRAEIRFRKAGYSLFTAVRTGLKIGLPVSALIAAIMPMLGMSWYFDTENWASGIWDKWAAARADTWRMAITARSGGEFDAKAFRLQPNGVDSNGDFSFVIIGDPGEGDASQLVLKDQILDVTNRPEVKFVVISSDVVYPTGALRDYEKKFWMPFKGVHKPVYAIPGNHDWYDALEGFVATFYEPQAAREAMMDRVRSEMHVTATTQVAIDDMVKKSAFWREAYGVPTGFQKAPYFQISTDDFAFISLETGVVRQIDSLQHRWLVNVLEASKGKFVMVLLGHPFYAIGEYQGALNPKFDELHQLLRKYNVPIAMAGDTHDLEYYKESAQGSMATMHHFVNGGGGAYLSIGAAMAEPGTMPTKEYAFYPPRGPLEKKITDNTAWYKYPAWWWALKLNGWPFSAEWLSAMFDYNVAPYFQSFVEVSVLRSEGRIVLIPYSNNGRLRWSEMTSTAGSRPAGAREEDFAEWSFPLAASQRH